MTALLVGTRGSALATAQAGGVARRLAAAIGGEAELVPVTTHGDVSRASLSSLGGTGVFAAALRESLLDGECDVVVHSMKDLPTASFPGLAVGAVPEREDARDALCARDGLTLAQLPEGARVGTGSPRRVAQLKHRRPDLVVVDIRGNVGTRLGFVDTGKLDAVVLAAAGLARLQLSDRVTEYFDLSDWPTAPAQGILAVEVRSADLDALDADAPLRRALAAVHDVEASAVASAERGVLARLEAGCAAPIGAHAVMTGDDLTVTARVYALDGSEMRTHTVNIAIGDVRPSAQTPGTAAPSHDDRALNERATRAGADLADALLAAGAADIAPLRES
ncbi:hydroxymethylbilane synthase [Paramicrobacterium chengjingii]|uniref:Porphobilinogen deaminase n=1 Tax=Paramicrobacterium chengjingii TaxID=2769067 RepID=A0ABX6YIT8_9MICO|nr:hydroxymethylbilane synthase [Microbacterium chengjingii]QPZ38741.1 hydroxymethylbilane synthase [Microbacterium chengjingii]